MHEIQICEQCSIKLVLCPTIAVPPQQIPTTAHIHRTHTARVCRWFHAFLRFPIHIRFTQCDIFIHIYLCICATHFMSPYFFSFFFYYHFVVHVQKDLFKWIMFIHCWIEHIPFLCGGRKRHTERERMRESVFEKGFAFDTNEYIHIQVCYIDLIIFPCFYFSVIFLYCSHRFFMIKYGKQSVASKLWQRDSKKKRSF